MTFGDLIDQVASDSGDAGAAYRNSSRRWLNLARSKIADQALWRQGVDATATFTATASSTGIFQLTGYEFVAGDSLYDETSNVAIRHESLAGIGVIDPSRRTTGAPFWWTDAGMDSLTGDRRIKLWPMPNADFVIRFEGYRRLTDITSGQDSLSVDPFFGGLTFWAPLFVEGLRYYHDLNNNENPEQIALQRNAFAVAIREKERSNRLSLTSTLMMNVVNTQQLVNTGRFDPAHYHNG